MALQKKFSSNDMELISINRVNNNGGPTGGSGPPSATDPNGNGLASIMSVGGIGGGGGGGSGSNNNSVKMPSKKIQFSNPEFSITPIETLPGSTVRPAPSRRREEAIVMANLRKRVAACDLNKNGRKQTGPGAATNLDDISINDTGQTQDALDNRPLLPKSTPTEQRKDRSAQGKDRSGNNGASEGGGEDSPKVKIVMDKEFIFECLCWHNEYRMRHGAPALSVSSELCEYAKQWANHLASTNELYYQIGTNYGQNIFCCPANSLLTDLSGQEVATYWYSTSRRYDYFKEPHLLHTNVNTGHFSQMVWRGSRYFGVSKSISKTGKLFVVAYYYPAGNVMGEFRQNVLPPIVTGGEQEGGSQQAHLSRPPSAKDLENLGTTH
uniref:SCP domain-containing protein n=1 Tax=Anopheles farauti TaxID=69004 RepID=A0A182QUC1_9DIPT